MIRNSKTERLSSTTVMSENKPNPKPNPKPKPKQKRITIELPKDLEAVYANIAFITHTPAEMVIDFAQVLPRTPKGQIVSRLIMSPMHAKSFLNALQTNIQNYERQYGEINVPKQPNLADQLFNFPPPEEDGGSETDQKE